MQTDLSLSQSVMEAAPIGVAVTLPDGTIAFANERLCEMFGIAKETFVGSNARDFYWDAEERKAAARQVAENGLVSNLEVALKKPDGAKIWGLLSLQKTDYRGEPATLGWIYDITDRKKAEQDLHDSEERAGRSQEIFQALADNIPDFIAMEDKDGRYIFVNKEFEKWAGKQRQDVIGKTVFDIYDRELAASFQSIDQQAIHSKEVTRKEMPITFPDGVARDVIRTLFPVVADDGSLLGLGTVNQDVTERKRAEQQQAQLLAQLDTVLSNVVQGVAMFDAENRLQTWNTPYEEVLNLPEGFLEPGLELMDLGICLAENGWYGGGDPVALAKARVESLLDGTEGRADIETGDGRIFEVLKRPTADGGLVVTYTDVTGRKRERDRFRALLESAPDATVIVDENGKIIQANQQTETVFGYSPEELIGQAVEILMPVRYREGHPAFRQMFVENASVRPMGGTLELFGLKKSGDEFSIEISLSPITTDEGTLVSAAVRDVTKRKVIERALRNRSKLVQLLRQTAEMANKAQSFEEALEGSLRGVCDTFEWPVGHAYLASPDDPELLVPSGIWHLASPERFETFKRVTEQTEFRKGEGLPGVVLANRRPEWIEDVMRSDNFPRAKADPTIGVHSAFAVPVLRDDAVVAVLEFFTDETLVNDESTFQTFRTVLQIGDQLGQVLRRVEAEAGLKRAKEEAERALEELGSAQQRLVQTEKMASLGQLTAGIAHEIKNPLNFVNNFSETSVELLEELDEVLTPALETSDKDVREEAEELLGMLKGDLQKIHGHGKRADGIVKSMLLHARGDAADRMPTVINELVDEALNLAYHGERARDKSFNVTFEKKFDDAAGTIEVVPQEITRVLVNIFSNAFYAMKARQAEENSDDYSPVIAVSTAHTPSEVRVQIRDNGTGMPEEVREKLFDPFFTTKPTGEGTGLGLSMSYDIIAQQHGGRIDVDSERGSFTEFSIALPYKAS